MALIVAAGCRHAASGAGDKGNKKKYPEKQIDMKYSLVVRNPPVNADMRDLGLIPGLGRSPGGGHGNPLQYSCLEDPTDRGACQVIVHRVAKSWT